MGYNFNEGDNAMALIGGFLIALVLVGVATLIIHFL